MCLDSQQWSPSLYLICIIIYIIDEQKSSLYMCILRYTRTYYVSIKFEQQMNIFICHIENFASIIMQSTLDGKFIAALRAVVVFSISMLCNTAPDYWCLCKQNLSTVWPMCILNGCTINDGLAKLVRGDFIQCAAIRDFHVHVV